MSCHIQKFDEFLKEGQKTDSNWYVENVEEPVRDIVQLLRNEGFNTESSCGHNMEIQCKYFLDEEINRLHKLLYHYLHDKGLPITYEITVTIKVLAGSILRSTIHIQFLKKKLSFEEYKDIALSAGGFNPPDSNYEAWKKLNTDIDS
jgi:hypothetical protein